MGAVFSINFNIATTLPGLASTVGNDKSTTLQRSCYDPTVRNDVFRTSPVLSKQQFLKYPAIHTPITVDQTAPFQTGNI